MTGLIECGARINNLQNAPKVLKYQCNKVCKAEAETFDEFTVWICAAHSWRPPLFTVAGQQLQCQLISHRRGDAVEEKHCWLHSTTMAAEIHSRPQTARPVLLNKIEGHSDAVTGAVLIPKEDGVITVSEDR